MKSFIGRYYCYISPFYLFLLYIFRLPQELFQTSKIAKLLLKMERGIDKDDHGKSLDEIDVELEAQDCLETQENASKYLIFIYVFIRNIFINFR